MLAREVPPQLLGPTICVASTMRSMPDGARLPPNILRQRLGRSTPQGPLDQGRKLVGGNFLHGLFGQSKHAANLIARAASLRLAKMDSQTLVMHRRLKTKPAPS